MRLHNIWSDNVFQPPEHSRDIVTQAFEDFACDRITEHEFEHIRYSILPQCKAKDLYNCPYVFARVIKSTEEIAQQSCEHHRKIPTAEYTVSSVPAESIAPMSFTIESHLLSCLPYGDKVAYVSFNTSDGIANGLEDEVVARRGMGLEEYCARHLFITTIHDINNEEFFRHLLKTADPHILRHELDLEKISHHANSYYLQTFGLHRALSIWTQVVQYDKWMSIQNPQYNIQDIKAFVDTIPDTPNIDDQER